MSRLQRSILCLYPSAWRKRYGGEMEALLSDSRSGRAETFNLFLGAIHMQFRSRSFAQLALLWSLGGLAVGYAGSYLIPTTYLSEALLQIRAASAEQANSRLIEIENQVLSRTSLMAVLNTPYLHLSQEELKKEPIEDVIERMRSGIRIMVDSPPNRPQSSVISFLISFDYPGPQAGLTVRELSDLFIQAGRARPLPGIPSKDPVLDALQRIDTRLTALEDKAGLPTIAALPITNDSIVQVINPYSGPKPISPNRASLGATGFGAGFLIACLVWASRKLRTMAPEPATMHLQ